MAGADAARPHCQAGVFGEGTLDITGPADPAGLETLRPGHSVARNSAVLVVGTIGARGAAFVAAVILARRFEPAAFAVIVLAQATAQYLAMLVDFGFTITGIRLLAERPSTTRSVMGAIVCIRIAIGTLGVVATWSITMALGFSAQAVAVFVLFAVSTALAALDVSWVAQAREATGTRALVLGGTATLALAILVIGLAIRSDPVVAPIAQVIGAGTFAVVSLVVVGRRYGLPSLPDRVSTWAVARIAIPIGLATLLAQVYYNLDLILLGILRTSAEVGTYGAIYKIILGLLALGWTYSLVILPRLTKARSRSLEDQRAELGRRIRQLVVVIVPVALLAALLSAPIIVTVFGPRYVDGAAPLSLLLASVPISSVGSLVLYSLAAAGRTWALPISSGCGAVVNVILNLILISRYGMIGAAWATILAVSLVLVLALFQAREHLPSWDRLGTLRLVTSLAAMAVVALIAHDLPLPVPTTAGAVAFVVVAEVLGLVREESTEIRRLIAARFGRASRS